MTLPLDSALVRLTDDVQIPAVGFGTYLISNDEVTGAVGTALGAGFRHVDTAEAYQNEVGVGRALRAAMDGGLRRDELFVTTKLFPGNPAWGVPAKTFDTTIASLDASLERLGLDHVDLYLIHAPLTPDERVDQWRGLLELREQGKARAIGVSNFSQVHIEELLAAGLPLPDANQIELHPWSQKRQLVYYLRGNSIGVIAYSSLAPLSTWRTAEGQDSAKTDEMRAAGESPDSPFAAMARKHGVSEAQVLLRWGVQQGYAVLPKSTNPERIAQNADLFSFRLDDQDMASIAQLDRGTAVAWAIGDPTTFA
ncbi:MAG: aldo/keto reductase [Candidatus Nanopelagicales bacterium]